MILAIIRSVRSYGPPLVMGAALLFHDNAGAQTNKRHEPVVPNELAKLREEFIKATKDYQTSLARLLAIHERKVKIAEEKLVQSQKLFAEGLISKNTLTEAETELAAANDRVQKAQSDMAKAESEIANAMVEAQAQVQINKTPQRRGSLLNTTSYIRYTGARLWTLSDAWKVQRFFMDSLKKQLPVAVFGQGPIHDRWRLDHRNAMDVPLHPDGPEGQLLMNYLRANGIPFLAFRTAMPGTSTGPHIHIGRPSHRF